MNNTVEIERVREYLSGQEDVKLGIVFGSLASNKAGLNSDLDVAISADQPLTVERKMDLIAGLAGITGRSVDLVDLRTVGEPLLGQILAGGRRILGSDQSYARLVTRHLFDQADFLPYRERLLAERRGKWLQK
jgi:uncharacterized protein